MNNQAGSCIIFSVNLIVRLRRTIKFTEIPKPDPRQCLLNIWGSGVFENRLHHIQTPLSFFIEKRSISFTIPDKVLVRFRASLVTRLG
jgi:hypothetical protein